MTERAGKEKQTAGIKPSSVSGESIFLSLKTNSNVSNQSLTRVFVSVLSCLILFSVCSYAWEARYGGISGFKFDTGYDALQTSDGGFLAVGHTNSFGVGLHDIYMVKTDAFGNQLWQATFGGTSSDEAYNVVETIDGGFVMCGTTRSFGNDFQIYIVKSDSSGNLIWQNNYGNSYDDRSKSMDDTSDGGFIVTGIRKDPGHTDYDVPLLKLDSVGNVEWSRSYGGSNNDEGNYVIQTSDGGYIVAGKTGINSPTTDALLIRTDSVGNELWRHTYGGSDYDRADSVVQTPDGGFIVIGTTESTGTAQEQLYLFKVDMNGTEEWSKTYGGTYGVGAAEIIITSDGGLAITGGSKQYDTAYGNAYLMKTDFSGTIEWERSYGNWQQETSYSVRQLPDGGYIMCGSTASYCGSFEVYVIRTDAIGNSNGIPADCTPTFTATFTVTPTETIFVSETPSVTFTASLTMTPTLTSTLSITETATPTATPTVTMSHSATSTQVSTPPHTVTPEVSATTTAMPLLTNTYTPTRTFTITITLTPALTMTNTAAYTFSPTSTMSLPPTLIMTPTATLTHTRTMICTPTVTPTSYFEDNKHTVIEAPNPVNFSKGETIKFFNAAPGSYFYIYSISCEFIITKIADENGKAEWNGRNAWNTQVSTGVYFYIAENRYTGQLNRGKFFVVRK